MDFFIIRSILSIPGQTLVLLVGACWSGHAAPQLPLDAAKRKPVQPSFSFSFSTNPNFRPVPKPAAPVPPPAAPTAAAAAAPVAALPEPVEVQSAPIVNPEVFPFAYQGPPVVTQRAPVAPQPVPVAMAAAPAAEEISVVVPETPPAAPAAPAAPSAASAAIASAFQFSPPFVLNPLDQDGEYTFSSSFA